MNRKKLFTEINKNMLGIFGDKLNKIYLFGSYAIKKQNKESDIDFFVLVDDTDENLRKNRYKITDIMTRLSLDHDILVSITEETCIRYKQYSDIIPLYKNITQTGIEIYGK